MTEKQARGFATMDKSTQREIASEGGRAAHRSGNAHQFTSEEASRAAKLGHAKRKARTQLGGARVAE